MFYNGNEERKNDPVYFTLLIIIIIQECGATIK